MTIVIADYLAARPPPAHSQCDCNDTRVGYAANCTGLAAPSPPLCVEGHMAYSKSCFDKLSTRFVNAQRGAASLLQTAREHPRSEKIEAGHRFSQRSLAHRVGRGTGGARLSAPYRHGDPGQRDRVP